MEKKFHNFFSQGPKLPIRKFENYLPVYARHFERFLGRKINILEIGVLKGGSLEMWNHVFDKNCNIWGVDVNKECKKLEQKFDNVKIFIGDQSSPDFWETFRKTAPKFDIIIDDGGHTMKQQINTFNSMYDHVKDDGVYLCEDTHTSYWRGYGGGLRKGNTFIDFTKNLIDELNAAHWRKDDINHNGVKIGNLTFTKKTNSIHYYDSIVVFEKKKNSGGLNLKK